ncbi:alpha/beta hydrolase [Acetivibrio straminisolvens]|jgi:acetyl esterase/lipase|nr:alpha/beta hydrolase [Acetivibrio straminisolvens]
MNRYKKMALKALSYCGKNLKKNYRLYRKFTNAVKVCIGHGCRVTDREIIVGDRKIPVRFFYPKNEPTSGILIFFHGGGWVTGNIESYTHVCCNMANQTRNTVVSVDYRLAPEHPFPKGLEDCYDTTREFFKNLDILDCKAEDITLIGDSAGGNLAAAVSLMARDRGEFLPKRQILIYPSTYNDHSETSPFPSIRENGTGFLLTSEKIRNYMDMYAPRKEDRLSPYLAPLLAQDLFKQPDTLIITAEYDPLRDEGEAYGARLKEYGNNVKMYRMKDAVHGFFSLPWKSQYVIRTYEIINWFLSSYNGQSEELI